MRDKAHAERPDSVPDTWAITSEIQVSFGPLVRWSSRAELADCPACSASGELRARGDNGKYYYVEYPECEGAEKVQNENQQADNAEFIWATAYGEIVDPELNPDGTINHFWLMNWAREKTYGKAA